jgi:hypothetical protein
LIGHVILSGLTLVVSAYAGWTLRQARKKLARLRDKP